MCGILLLTGTPYQNLAVMLESAVPVFGVGCGLGSLYGYDKE